MNSRVKKAAIAYLSLFCHGKFKVEVEVAPIDEDIEEGDDLNEIYRIGAYSPPLGTRYLDAEHYYFKLDGEGFEDLDDFKVWGEPCVWDWQRVEKFVHVFE